MAKLVALTLLLVMTGLLSSTICAVLKGGAREGGVIFRGDAVTGSGGQPVNKAGNQTGIRTHKRGRTAELVAGQSQPSQKCKRDPPLRLSRCPTGGWKRLRGMQMPHPQPFPRNTGNSILLYKAHRYAFPSAHLPIL